MHTRKLSGFTDPYLVLRSLKGHKHPFLLESRLLNYGIGRYSFLGADPFLTLSAKGNIISQEGRGIIKTQRGCPLKTLDTLLQEYAHPQSSPLPFGGGAVGYLGYELKKHIEVLPESTTDDLKFPDLWFGFYEGALVFDHLKNEVFATAYDINGSNEKVLERLSRWYKDAITAAKPSEHKNRTAQPKAACTLDEGAYVKAVQKTLDYIGSGDIYQANISTRFSTKLTSSPIETYGRLRELNKAPFAAYIDIGGQQILSSSPERFLKISGNKLEMRPIKGTAPRGATSEEDAANKEKLLTSAKDQAELLMIVDLIRNDLGRISKTGSVKVKGIYDLETYATVHHLTSTVESICKENISLKDILKATFPGGSITGAPKVRSMEVIDELEPTHRGVYTGAIGYFGFDGQADLNIAIRTIVTHKGNAHFQVGSGIVADSSPEKEYQESLSKGKALLQTLLNN